MSHEKQMYVLFEAAITKKEDSIEFPLSFLRHTTWNPVIDTLIKTYGLQNIHNVGKGSFIIEYQKT